MKKNYLYKTRSIVYILSTRRLAIINNINLLDDIDDYNRFSSNIFNSKN